MAMRLHIVVSALVADVDYSHGEREFEETSFD
jgi:hypothetical protein